MDLNTQLLNLKLGIVITQMNADCAPLFNGTKLVSQFVVFQHFLSTEWLRRDHWFEHIHAKKKKFTFFTDVVKCPIYHTSYTLTYPNFINTVFLSIVMVDFFSRIAMRRHFTKIFIQKLMKRACQYIKSHNVYKILYSYDDSP